MKQLLIILLSFFLAQTTLYGQGRKKAEKNNLKSETVWSQNDKGIKVKESFTRFDKEGNVTEEIEYDETGTKIIKHNTYTYNSDNDVLEEKQLNPSGKLVKTIKYKYNEDEKVIQEDHITAAGKIEKVIKYKYNNKLKTEKAIYDAAGKVRKRKMYAYEKYEE